MTQFYLVPRWFFGYDIALEIIFGVITLLLALYSFRIYRLSTLRESRVLGWGFLSMSLGYFAWSALNLYVTSRLNASGLDISLQHLFSIASLGVSAHIFFLVMGSATLAYMALSGRSNLLYSTLLTLSLLIIVFAFNKALAFYFVSSFLLFLVLIHYVSVYRRRHHPGTLLLLFAFFFIFAGNVVFIFATLHAFPYVIGHLLQLLGYLLALVSLISILRS